MDPISEIMGRLDGLDVKLENIESIHLGAKEIELTTRAKALKMYHNGQLKKLMALNINLKMFEGMKDEDVVAEAPIQGMPNVQGSTTMRKITVKQQKEKESNAKGQLLRLIRTVEDLLKEEGVEVTSDVMGK